jgi:hypothetical protein
MSEQFAGVSLSVFLVLVNLIAFVYFTKVLYGRFKLKIQQIKKFKLLAAKKCKGPHIWLTISVEGSQTHVCRECYFAPKHDTFVKEYYVKEAIYTQQFEADYKKYLDKKVQEMALFYGIDGEEIIEINEKIVQIKQEFSLQYLKKMIQEMSQDLEEK